MAKDDSEQTICLINAKYANSNHRRHKQNDKYIERKVV